MTRTPLILSGMALGLSACVSTPAPQKGSALAGAYAVAYGEGRYAAQVAAGPMGHALGRTGAVPVAGLTVTISSLGMDEGRRAKSVAAEACAQAKGRFQPQAVGRFAQGAWVFEGACA